MKHSVQLLTALSVILAVIAVSTAAVDLTKQSKMASGASAYPPPFLAVSRSPNPHPQQPSWFVIPQVNFKWSYGGPPAAFSGFVDASTGQFGFPGMGGVAPLEIAFDDEKLVFVLTIPRPYRRAFRMHATEADTDFSGDDRFELLIAPLDGGKHLRDRVYRIAGSPGGAHAFRIDDPAIGQYDLPWNNAISYGNGMMSQGQWNVAVQIPFSELGGKPKDGDVWGVQLLLHYADPPITAQLAPTDPVEHPAMAWQYFSRVRFDHTPGVNFRAHYFGEKKVNNRFDMGLLLSNTSLEREGRVRTELALLRGGKELATADWTGTVPPNTRYHAIREPSRLSVQGALANHKEKDSVVRIRAFDAATKRVIYDQFLPFWCPDPTNKSLVDEYFGREFSFMTGPYPSLGFFDFRLDAKTLKDANPAAAKARVEVRLADKTVATKTYSLPENGVIEEALRVGDMPDGGIYTITAAILDRDGAAINAKTDTFTRRVMPFETAPRPGLSDIVAPPFTPSAIRTDGLSDGHAEVSCWNRDYQHGTAGLLTGLTAAGQELLTRPVRFVVELGNGRSETLVAADKPNLKLQGKGRVDYAQTFVGGGVRLAVTGEFDYDGFYRFRVTLAPESAPVDIRRMKLEIALRNDVAKLLETPYEGSRREEAKNVMGALGDRRGRVWDSKSWPYSERWRKGNMPPFVWLGDDERGLIFSCVSEEGMYNDDALPAASIDRDAAETVLTVWAVNRLLTLGKARTFEFALQATPYKPMPKNWRLWRTTLGRQHPLFGTYARNGVFFHTGWGERAGAYPCYSRFANLDVLKASVDLVKNRGFDYVGAVASARSEGAGTPEYRQFWHEWGSTLGFDRQPRSPLPAWAKQALDEAGIKDQSPLALVEAYSNNYRSNRDYRSWWLDQEVRHAGIGAIYQDNTSFDYVDNPLLDYGYTRDDGTRDKTSVAWNARDFMRRVRHIMVENGQPESPGVFANLISPAAPGRSFCGKFLTGEDPNSDSIPLDCMRIWFSKQWGMTPTWYWSPSNKRRPVSYWRTVAGRLFLLDVVDVTRGDVADCFDRWWLALDTFWLDDPGVVWHPYYRNGLVKATKRPDTLVSGYTAQGRALFVVSNQAKEDTVAEVTLNPLDKHTGLPLTHYYDAETGEKIETADTTLKMFIPELDYRLVLGFPEPWAFDARQALKRPDLPVCSTVDRRLTIAELVRQLQQGHELEVKTFVGAHPLAEAWIRAIVEEVKRQRDANPGEIVYHSPDTFSGISGLDSEVRVAVIERRSSDRLKRYRLILYLNTSGRDLLMDSAVREAIQERAGVKGDRRANVQDAIEGFSFQPVLTIPPHSGRIELLRFVPEDVQRKGISPAGTFYSNLANAALTRREKMEPTRNNEPKNVK